MKASYRMMKRNSYRIQRAEKHDCAVVALALAGRKLCRGINMTGLLQAANISGLAVRDWKNIVQPNGCQYTPKTIGARFPTGYYLVSIQSHVFALIDGVVEDWTAGRCHRIVSIYRIRRPI